jgi:hypothetical protein
VSGVDRVQCPFLGAAEVTVEILQDQPALRIENGHPRDTMCGTPEPAPAADGDVHHRPDLGKRLVTALAHPQGGLPPLAAASCLL